MWRSEFNKIKPMSDSLNLTKIGSSLANGQPLYQERNISLNDEIGLIVNLTDSSFLG